MKRARNRLGGLFALVALLAGMRAAPAQTCRYVPRRECEVRTKSATGEVGVVLMVDGKPRGVADSQEPPLLLAPGPHTFYVERGNQRGSTTEFECQSGGRVELEPSLSPDRLQGVSAWASVLVLADRLGPDLQRDLRSELTRKLETVNLLTVPPDRAALADPPSIDGADCQDLVCTGPALDCLGAQWALHISPPTADAPTRYRLRLRDHRVWNGFFVTTVDPGPELAQIVNGLVAAAYDLIAQRAWTPQQVVRITSIPAGAEVRLNGIPAGRTPWSHQLYNGNYTVELQRSGYLPFRAPLSVVTPLREPTKPAGEPSRPAVNPNQLVVPLQLDPVIARRRAIQRGFAWSSLVTGVLSLGAGVTLLALHGQQFDCDPQDSMVCTRQLDSQTGGIVATVAGGMLIGVTCTLFGLAAREPKKSG